MEQVTRKCHVKNCNLINLKPLSRKRRERGEGQRRKMVFGVQWKHSVCEMERDSYLKIGIFSLGDGRANERVSSLEKL